MKTEGLNIVFIADKYGAAGYFEAPDFVKPEEGFFRKVLLPHDHIENIGDTPGVIVRAVHALEDKALFPHEQKPCIILFGGAESFTDENIYPVAIALQQAAERLPGVRLILCLYGPHEITQGAKERLPSWFAALFESVFLTPGTTEQARGESLRAALRGKLIRPIVPVPDMEPVGFYVAGASVVLLVANPIPGMFTDEEAVS